MRMDWSAALGVEPGPSSWMKAVLSLTPAALRQLYFSYSFSGAQYIHLFVRAMQKKPGLLIIDRLLQVETFDLESINYEMNDLWCALNAAYMRVS